MAYYNRNCQKALIADYISQYNDLIFASPTGYSGFETLMGVIGYTMQIYCDFSGYSDMAIGIALIMGFKLCLNFDFLINQEMLLSFGDIGTYLCRHGCVIIYISH